jgi:galactose-1-phosphate uridylyltransferase
MSRRITDVSNLVEVVENKMISVDSVECKTKFSADMTETNQITPNKFIESIQFMNETIFKDAIDFFYEFTDTNNILIECGMKNIYMEEYYRVKCSVYDGVSAKEVDKKLRETIFDRMDKKLAV